MIAVIGAGAAGTVAAILAIASLPFHGAVLVIDFFNEE